MTSHGESWPNRVRYRLGRWLLRPKSAQIVRHYKDAAEENKSNGKYQEETNCTYMAIGAQYVGWRGPHG